MKIWIFSTLFVAFLSCKKENTSLTKPEKDSAKVVTENIAKDSVALSQTSGNAKEEIFSFATELCDNKGHFDPNKYTRQEIEGTYKLWFTMSGVFLSTPSVFNLKDLQKVRAEKDQILAKLNEDFLNKKKELEGLMVVKDPYWQNIKTQKIQELINEYEFRKTEIQAFSNPSILVKNKLSKGCENFVNALNSDETHMMDEWRKLREAMSKRNGNPQRIINEFEEHLNSPDKKDYAIADLITFGWGNCANSHSERIIHDENMYKKFNSLFLKIDSECDEP